jgi:L-fucose isomerase-like protein
MHQIPANTFLNLYQQTPTSPEMESMAKDYIRAARSRRLASYKDVINGIKSYWVAQTILEHEHGDAITMDCLGALGKSKISLPCIAWSRMNDDGIPAACEADQGAVASHILCHYLFDRPGFQQDPVADTTDDAIIGAHCSCPTRLNGYREKSEPFEIIHHHGNRDAVPRTLWKEGQRITCLDVLPGKPSELLISTGTVLENISVPPAGGCVVSVKAKFDGSQNVLSFPGFHQLFFYGDYKKELQNFCQLMNFKATIV